MMRGIDIYDGNGLVDFNKVKADGFDFVIIKCGGNEGSRWTTKNFYRSYVKAKAAGLHVGAYWYAGQSCGASAGEADAIYCADILAGCQLDFPVFYDFEEGSKSKKQENTDACRAFCDTMEDAGYYVGIYGSDISVFEEMLHKEQLTSYDWWIARYGKTPVNSYSMWQYSSSGRVAGVPGACDLNDCVVDYPGIIPVKHFNGY